MVPNVVLLGLIFNSFLLWSYVQAADFQEATQDQTSARTNTLLDDADDIQRQLDNEARDRIKYGRTKARKGSKHKSSRDVCPTLPGVDKDWNYKEQYHWPRCYPDCGGRSQSPVNLPYHGLIAAKTGRKMVFKNYDVKPAELRLINDGRRVILLGKWNHRTRPYIYGGAAHSRRYLFHSITLHWPSEHTVEGLQYPLESQALHVSSDYNSMEEAINGSASDPQAFLAVSTLYRFSNETHGGLDDLIKTAKGIRTIDGCVDPKPLSHFSPPFAEYACYQGSLSAPPCTEAVLWLVRGRTLPVTRESMEAAQSLLGIPGEYGKVFSRSTQPLNDRKVYYFKF